MDTRMNRMLYRGFYVCTCRVGSGTGGDGCSGGCSGGIRGGMCDSGRGFGVMKGAIGGSSGCEEG